jgi:TolB-like protein/Tfp pilus assembly protein PilF
MERRLAAILAADVAGYSRLMEADEQATLAALATCRSIIDELVAEHRGRIFSSAGDSVVAEFSSPVEATRCALAIQRTLASGAGLMPDGQRMQFRIGVNLGDLSWDGENLLGNGVNIAARLEQIAPPGGICLSGTAHDHLAGALDIVLEDAGEQKLKNISRPVRAWRWMPEQPAAPETPTAARASAKTAIAVLPFDNMSDDPEQVYFADGLTEDLITALSKHRWLDVAARNTTFAYKGQSPDIRKLGQELGADYVVEGSVRRAGPRIRVTAQLIDTATGSHIWAERYDRQLEDIFDVQDEITGTIVGRIEPEIGFAIRQKVQRAPRRDLHAWDCYHLGIANFYKFTAEGNQEAQRLLQQSRELDPDFAEAHAWWAYATVLGMVYWDTEPEPELMDAALAAAREAVALDGQNALLYMLMGRVQLARREYRSALTENEKAISLNPTLAPAYCGLGDSLAYEGRYDEAIAQFKKAVEMSPNHPQLWAFLSYGALAFLFDRQFENALEWAERARDIPNCQYWATAHSVVALAFLGRAGTARRRVESLLSEEPNFTLAFAEKRLFYLKRPEQKALYLEGLEKAGVPAG